MRKDCFQLEIVSAEEQIFSGTAQKLFVAGLAGEMEILVNHAALITSLVPGPVWVIKENLEEEAFVILGGMLEVQPHATIILAQSVMRASDIDEAAALDAKKRAEDLMANHGGGKMNYSLAHSELALALAQLRILRKLRRGA